MDNFINNLLGENPFHILYAPIDLWMHALVKFPWIFGLIAGWAIVSYLVVKIKGKNIIFIYIMLSTIVLHPLQVFILPKWSPYILNVKKFLPIGDLFIYLISFMFGMLMSFLIYRYVVYTADVIKNKIQKTTSLGREKATDIRTILSELPQARANYKPSKYFKKKKIFIGKNKSGAPIYIDIDKWRSSHVQLIGTTGAGKGVAAANLLCQAIRQGESVIVFDPKDDEFLPHVLAAEAKNQNTEYFYIDLTAKIGQINLLSDKTKEQSDELLMTGFDMGGKGSEGDFYRNNDRAACRLFSDKRNKSEDFNSSVGHFISEYSEVLADASKFITDIEELASLPVLSAKQGLDVAEAISKGSVIYIRGSLRLEPIKKLQKMLLISIVQFIEERDRETARHVCIFMDEFKYLISRPALEALGTIRDKRAHVILAHQSIGDLRDVPNDLNPDSVTASVNENCSIKIAYKVLDPDTAEWLSRMSGKILVDDELRNFTTSSLTEIIKPDKTLRQAERNLIDTNMLLSLPPRCAVVYGNGLADFVFISPIKVERDIENSLPTIFDDEPFHQNTINSFIAEELINVD